MKNLQSYLGDFDFYLGKSSELPAEPLSADEPSQVASTGSGSLFHVGSNALAGAAHYYGCYECADGKFIVIGANGDSIFKRLCEQMGRPDMAEDARYASNDGRVEHEEEIDEAIAVWTTALDSVTALSLLDQARVPSGPIYSVADMMVNEHFIARGLFEEVDVNGKTLKIPAMIPKLSETPGRTDWAGPEVGAFNDEVYGDLLGLSAGEISSLKQKGVL